MVVHKYIKEFEKLGFGLFVHFGLYSILECGEWNLEINKLDHEKYNDLIYKFNPSKSWARNLVLTAKRAGCKYITITTRHHDGFSLYDTQGLTDFDAPHSKCGRDIIREFVDECNNYGIKPFFYHTLLDWYQESFKSDFKAYLKYLRDSVRILCTNYGKIGGIWFDGKWSNPNADWEEDELYGMIRSLQPTAMIINNTGTDALGQLGHIELDSVTFERGNPLPINLEGSPKYIASEMCQTIGEHWGYARDDYKLKGIPELITNLCDCRKYGSNFLLNVGPKPDGSLRPIDEASLLEIGQWVKINEEAIREPRPTDIKIDRHPESFILRKDDVLYLFCYNLSMVVDLNPNKLHESEYEFNFDFKEPIKKITWLDSKKEKVQFSQKNGKVSVHTVKYKYGKHLVIRVAKIELKDKK